MFLELSSKFMFVSLPLNILLRYFLILLWKYLTVVQKTWLLLHSNYSEYVQNSMLYQLWLPRAIVGHKTHKREEVMTAAGVLFHLLVDSLCYVRRKDLHQSGSCQSSHGVVLDGSAWKVSISYKGKVIDGPWKQNNVNEIFLVWEPTW